MTCLPFIQLEAARMAYQTMHLSPDEFTIYHKAIYEIWISGGATVTRLARQMSMSREESTEVIERLVIEIDDATFDGESLEIGWVTDLRERQEALVEAKSRGGRKGKEDSIKSVEKSVDKSLKKSVDKREEKSLPSKERKKERNKEIKRDCASEEADTSIALLNELSGKDFKLQKRSDLEGRISEYGLPAVLDVVRAKCEQWKDDPQMKQYLRPETIFNKTKFEGYAETSKPTPPPPPLRPNITNPDGSPGYWSPPE